MVQEAAGGDGEVTYSLHPALPPGLTLSAASRTLSGTPTAPRPAESYRWIAADEDGDAASLTFTIRVEPDRRPSFAAAAGPDLLFRVGRPAGPETLPAAVGGDGRIAYAVSPPLPRGLRFAPDTRTISGEPEAVERRRTYTLTATDRDGDRASLPFTLAATSAPELQSLRLVSRPENGHTYLYGEVIAVEARFSEQVLVAESATLALTVGMETRWAMLMTNSGRALRFTYEVDEDDHDPDGVSISSGGSLRLGTLMDGALDDATLVHRPLPDQMGHRVDGAPQRVGTLPSVSLTLGGEPARVEVGGAFHAAFRHTVASSAPEVASVRLEGTTVVVTALAEGQATVLVSGQNAGGAAEQRFEVTVATARAEREVVDAAVAGFARSLLSSASATVGRRLLGASAPGGDSGDGTGTDGAASVTLSGLPTDDRLRLEEALRTSRAFALSAARPGGSRWTVWGAGDLQQFRGGSGADTYEGRPLSSWLGVDVARGGALAGLAVSRSAGDTDYTFSDLESGVAGTGRLDADLLQVHPYVSWSPDGKTRVWGQAGFGRGAATLTRSAASAPEEADLDLVLGLAGLRRALGTAGGASVALRADLGGARLTASRGGAILDGLASTVTRGRLGLELTASLGPMTPFFEFGGRYDGGAGATGAGLEVAGGLRVEDAAGRVGVEARGRLLALHAAAGAREAGLALTARFTPQGAGRGLTMEVRPAWGAPAEGAGTLWQDRDFGGLAGLGGLAGGPPPAGSFAARVSYAFGLWTPFTETSWSDALSRNLRAGVRLGRPGDAVDLEVTGARSARPAGAPDYRLDLNARLRVP